MSHAIAETMDAEGFLRWAQDREGRFEFVDGTILRMQAGTASRHDRVVVNLIIALGNRLRGKSCQPFTADFAVRTGSNRIRRPDVGFDCGERDPDALVADRPVLVVEVFSPSTRDFDRSVKIAEYQSVASIRTILYVEPNQPEVYVFERAEDRVAEEYDEWQHRVFRGLQETIPIPVLDIVLPLAEVFEDLDVVRSPFLL